MQTQAEYQALAQAEVDALVPSFQNLETRIETLVALAQEFEQKVCDDEIQGEVTVNARKVLRLTERFQDRVELAHAVGGKACAAAELNEGK